MRHLETLCVGTSGKLPILLGYTSPYGIQGSAGYTIQGKISRRPESEVPSDSQVHLSCRLFLQGHKVNLVVGHLSSLYDSIILY